jgi:hypothetical protein
LCFQAKAGFVMKIISLLVLNVMMNSYALLIFDMNAFPEPTPDSLLLANMMAHPQSHNVTLAAA